MPVKNPPHPGHSVKDACLDPLGLSVTDGAKGPGTWELATIKEGK
jgi:hypothetical protein